MNPYARHKRPMEGLSDHFDSRFQALTTESENVKLLRDFYLILIGIVISYFVGITVTYNSLASPIVILEWIGSNLFHEGPSPSNDSITRSIGVTAVPIVSLFLYGFAWRYYERFLKNNLRLGNQVHLGKELPFIAFFGVSPIGILLLFSPSEALASYPTTLLLERFGISSITLLYILFFFYRVLRKSGVK